MLTLSIHCIPNILCKHWFTKSGSLSVWSCSIVMFPFLKATNTDLTCVLNRRIFVVLPITLDFHTFLKMLNAALALQILVFTSAYVPPCVSTILPTYLNDSPSSIPSPSSKIGLSQLVLCLMILVFFLVIFRPTYDEIRARHVVFSCIC